jgi:RNA polymerase sigma factor (sigma-70 family)
MALPTGDQPDAVEARAIREDQGARAVGRGRDGALSRTSGESEFSLDFETAMRRLPDGARQIFVLHDVEGYKHEEIATMLEVTAGTSKAQLHRARMLLRRVLGR